MQKVIINNQSIDGIVSFTMKRNYNNLDMVYIDLTLKQLLDACPYDKNEIIIMMDDEIIIAKYCKNINWNYDKEQYYVEFLVKDRDISIYKNVMEYKNNNFGYEIK